MKSHYQNLVKIQLFFLFGVQILCLLLHSITLQRIWAESSESIRYPGLNLKEF